MCAGSGHCQCQGLLFRGGVVCGWKPNWLGGLWEAGNEGVEGHVLARAVLPPQASALWCSRRSLHPPRRRAWYLLSASHPLASPACCPAPTRPASPALALPRKRKCGGLPGLVPQERVPSAWATPKTEASSLS